MVCVSFAVFDDFDLTNPHKQLFAYKYSSHLETRLMFL